MVDPEYRPPPGWSEDGLSAFLDAAQKNRHATFHNKRDWTRRLIKLDACFERITKGWVNPPDVVSPLLFIRCHAAFRASCGSAMAGQVTDLYPHIRACLEYAGYGLHIGAAPSLAPLWLNRHSDAASLDAVKKEFTIANVRRTIEGHDKHSAGVFDELYQRAIDFGGHPNERAISGSLAMNKDPSKIEFLQLQLHGDGLPLDHALKTTAQTGVCALEIFQCLYAARYELLGIRAALLDLRRGL